MTILHTMEQTDNLSNLKYNEMQKLAKQVGIKANMKFDRLKTALIEYYQAQSKEHYQKSEEKTKPVRATKEQEVVKEDEEMVPNPAATCPKGRRKAKLKQTKKNNSSKDDKASVMVSNKPKSTGVSAVVSKTPTIVKPVITKQNTPARTLTKSTKPTNANGKSTPLHLNSKGISDTPGNVLSKSVQKRKLSKTPVTEDKPSKRARKSSEIPSETSPRPSTRRSTFSVEKINNGDNSSNGTDVQDLVKAMDAEKTNEEMKKNLIKALDKKVQKTQSDSQTRKLANSTHIPRFAAFLEKKKQEQTKPITPGNKDWTKIHQKEFEKFDSIDVYLEKKRKHREETNMSVKKARLLVEQTKEAISRLKNHKTPLKENKVKPKPPRSASLLKSPNFNSSKEVFKPTVLSTKQMNLNFTRKSPRTSGNVFKPTITSTDKMNLDFGSMKTPSSHDTKTPKTDPRKSTGSIPQRKSFVTPFKFTATLNNTIDVGRSAKKPSFDLKASLSKPMTWKSHKGKLKPINDTYVTNNSAKSVKVKSREDRRSSAVSNRKEQKLNMQMVKRGLVA